MKFTPKREKDGGPVVNWLADQAQNLGSWLIKISMNYALFYEADITDEPKQAPEEPLECCGEGCCCGPNNLSEANKKGSRAKGKKA